MMFKSFYPHVTERAYTDEEADKIKKLKDDIERANDLGLQECSSYALTEVRRRKFVIESPAPLSEQEFLVMEAYFPEKKDISHEYVENLPPAALDALQKCREACSKFYIYQDGSKFGQRALVGVKDSKSRLLVLWVGGENYHSGGKESLPAFKSMAMDVAVRWLNGRKEQLGTDRHAAVLYYREAPTSAIIQGLIVMLATGAIYFVSTRIASIPNSPSELNFWAAFAIAALLAWWRGKRVLRTKREKIIKESKLMQAVQTFM